jgi:phenylacetate-CoA ligase
MLIVRGVNVFPSAIREVVGQFRPQVSGHIRVRPQSPGVKQDPPLPVVVELARSTAEAPGIADAVRERIRDVLIVQTRIELVPFGTLERSDYKAKLVEH